MADTALKSEGNAVKKFFNCESCNQVCKTKAALTSHIRWKHPSEPSKEPPPVTTEEKTDFFRKNWRIIVLVAYCIIVVLATYSGLIDVFINGPIEIIKINFDQEFVAIAGLYLIALTLVIALFYAIISSIHRITTKLPNWWLWSAVLGMILVFYWGFYIADLQFGVHDYLSQLKLRDNTITDQYGNLKEVGWLNCMGQRSPPYVGDRLSCSFEPKLKNDLITITFTYTNGTSCSENLSNRSFIAPSNVQYVSFAITGIDENDSFRNLSIGHRYSFLTPEIKQKKQDDFISALLVLIPLVIFSVPSAVDTWKNLMNAGKDGKK